MSENPSENPPKDSQELPDSATASSQAAPTEDGSSRPASVLEGDIYWPIPLSSAIILAAVFIALLVWRFKFDAVLISLIPFACVTALLAVIDLRELRLPNAITWPSTLAAVPLLALSTASTNWPTVSLRRALILGAATFVLYFIMWFGAAFAFGANAFGFGDVKLSPILGAQMGFFSLNTALRSILLTHLIAAGVALIVIAVLKIRGKDNVLKASIPLGPSMVLGSIIALIWYTF